MAKVILGNGFSNPPLTQILYWFKLYILFVYYMTSIKRTQNTITIQLLYKWDSEESQQSWREHDTI